jgi:hypothetical protein
MGQPRMPKEKEVGTFDGDDYDFVSDCWETLRSSRACDLYFGDVLDRASQTNFWFEIGLAATASGGTVAGLSFWQSSTGAIIWTGVGTIVAVAAWVKPFLKLDQKIKEYSKLQQAYREVNGSIRSLILGIRKDQRVSPNHWTWYTKINESMNKAAQQWPPKIDVQHLDRCKETVNKEEPADKLWMPKIKKQPPETSIVEQPQPSPTK